MNDRETVLAALAAFENLISLAESGEFYTNHDESLEALGRAKDGYEAMKGLLDRGRDG